MARLYVTEQGSVVHREGDRIVVRKEGQDLLSVPAKDVDAVILEGGAHATGPALRKLLLEGVDVAFATLDGRLVGRLVPPASKNVVLRIAQYETHLESEQRTRLARAVVEAKAANSVAVLRDWRSNHPDAEVAAAESEIEHLSRSLHEASLESLVGHEGSIARTYFGVFDRMLTGDLRFERRSTRPPHNEFNALLSFTYTLVGNEITSLLDGGGFDPHIGFYHGIDYGRPSLALDLLEPFRAPLCDVLVFRLVNLRMLRPEHFERANGGIYLKREAKAVYFREYERHLMRPGRSGLNWRQILRKQVEAAAGVLGRKEPWLLYRHESATLEEGDDALRGDL